MLVRISIEKLRAIALLNNSQQVRFLLGIASRAYFAVSLLFIYQGELSGFMQNSTNFFVKFCEQ
jgi:hypothetical protein